VQSVLEGRHHTEVARAAPQRPEQVRFPVRAHGAKLAVGRHHIGREQVVHRQAVLAHQPAQAPAQGQTCDPGVGHRPAGGGQAESLRLTVKLAPQDAALGPCGAGLGVDADPLHRRQVNDHAAIIGAVTGGAVTPAAHRRQRALLARETDRVPHIRDAPAACHQRRAPVDVAVPDPPGGVITGIADPDHLTPEHLAQCGHRLGVHLPGRISLLRGDCHRVPSLASPARYGD
jgi:hypothetical protein